MYWVNTVVQTSVCNIVNGLKSVGVCKRQHYAVQYHNLPWYLWCTVWKRNCRECHSRRVLWRLRGRHVWWPIDPWCSSVTLQSPLSALPQNRPWRTQQRGRLNLGVHQGLPINQAALTERWGWRTGWSTRRSGVLYQRHVPLYCHDIVHVLLRRCTPRAEFKCCKQNC